MHAGNAVRSISLLSLLVSRSVTQNDQTFCNRLYHSTVVANNKVYVDGGELRTITNGVINVAIPDTIQTIDLSKAFNNTDTSIWGNISKTGNSPSNNAPTLNDGNIFATNRSLFLFGGAISAAPGAPPVPPLNAVWQYPLDNNSHWGQAVVATGGYSPQRIHWGLAAQAVDSSVGYLLGGAITPKSDPAFNAITNAKPYMVQGLITIAEDSIDFANTSTTGLSPDGTTLGGFLALIESLGSGGILVAFGGITNVPGKPMALDDLNLADPEVHSVLGKVSVYDIGTQTWHQQTATGDVPPWRYVGCSVVVSAPDRSSHSVYIFGGWGNTLAGSDGSVYVLSIPSFRWIRVNSDSNRRARHQCNLIGKNTMLIVGGVQSNGEGLQPTDTTGCDTDPMFVQGLGMFSLNKHVWATKYDPLEGVAMYQIHPSISQVIGGNENGSARVQTPVGGFSQQALGTLLGAKQDSNATTSNSTNSTNAGHADISNGRKRFNGGIIAGVAVAVLACFAVLFVLVLCLAKRRRRRHKPSPPTISLPVLQMRQTSELSGVTSKDWNEGKAVAFELASTEKPLPSRPWDEKPAGMYGLQELEGEIGPERTVIEEDRKARIRAHIIST